MLGQIKQKIDVIRSQMPKAKKYGPKYFFSQSYRKKIKNREKKERDRRVYRSFIGNRKSLKDALLAKQRGRCAWCKEQKPREELSIDHVVRVEEGGTNKFNNLRLLCQCCHKIKDAARFENKPFKDAFRRFYESKK